MDYLESQIKQIKSLNKDENIITYKTISHGGFLTYDGIDVNGKRIANEITAETDKLTSNGNGVKKILYTRIFFGRVDISVCDRSFILRRVF